MDRDTHAEGRPAIDAPARAGLLAVVFYLVHGAVLVARGEPEHALWVCHLASLFVGVGLLARLALVNAIGVLWLSVGVPLWLIGLLGGDEVMPTSALTHIGGLAVGLYGARRLGIPRPTWSTALFAMVLLHLLSGALTPPAANVNFSTAIWPGWESVYPSHRAFVLVVLAGNAATFWVAQTVLRRIGWRPRRRPVSSPRSGG